MPRRAPKKSHKARRLPHGAVDSVTVKVDPKRRARYEKLSRIIDEARREESSGFDAYWEAVGEMLDASLYVDGGFETPEDYVRVRVKEPMRTVRRMVRVARYASPIEEARWGTTLLDAALGYIEALTGGPLKKRLPIELESLKIPVVRDGVEKKLPLDDLQTRDVVAATRRIVRPHEPTRSPAERVIAGELAQVTSLADVTVHVAEGVLRLGGVPLAALGHLAKSLAAAAAKIGGEPAKSSAKKATKGGRGAPKKKKKAR